MSWTAAAIVGGSVVGGLISSDASGKAADTQAAAADRASAVSQDQFNRTSRNLAPWLQTGKVALSQLAQGMGLSGAPGTGPESYNWNGGTYNSTGDLRAAIEQNYVKESGGLSPYTPSVQGSIDQWIERIVSEQPQGQGQTQQGQQAQGVNTNAPLLRQFTKADFEESPSYQFNLNEGMKAINKGAAARGRFYAPATLQDIGRYSQGLASNEFQNSMNNFYGFQDRMFNRLNTLSGSGQNAAVMQGGFGENSAKQIGSNIVGAGNAQAAGQIGQANAFTGAIGQGTNAYFTNRYLNNQDEMLRQMQQSSVPLSRIPQMNFQNTGDFGGGGVFV